MSIGAFTNKNLLPVQPYPGMKEQHEGADTMPASSLLPARVDEWFYLRYFRLVFASMGRNA
jgi:hypothetical protein